MKAKFQQKDPFFFGVHFMIDGYDAPKDILENKSFLTQSLQTIPKFMAMHTISEPIVVEVGPNNKKDPGGLSGMILIAESHFSFHTFPRRGFVTIDVYTCKETLDTKKLLAKLKAVFQFKTEETYIINRGKNYPVENIT